ncbi:maleylpyruvate isomerase N-terminal domain-containing protein [Pseudarthrobacter sp. NPDC057230]|uniref:maleylpyruvate isomerase N-terminal domain-containing protein n=1 Tax=Pseudarthrobacter sp. NPDC057230 TaxID=3346057 RepID=UPI003626B06E
MSTKPTSVLNTFLAVAEQVEEALNSKALEEGWKNPSALEGYTVAGLAGHLARGLLTVESYIGASTDDTSHLTDAAGYIVTVLGTHDPVDSDFHRTVRARSLDAASSGPTALAREYKEVRQRLSERLPNDPADKTIQVLQGVVLTVEEYLRTRLVEFVVHLDDLSVSVGQDFTENLPQEAYKEVAAVLAQVAVLRSGGLKVIRGLARRERHIDPVRAL